MTSKRRSQTDEGRGQPRRRASAPAAEPSGGDSLASARRPDHDALVAEVGSALTSVLDLEEVLPAIAERVARALDVWECDLYEYDADADTITDTAVWAIELSDADRDWVGKVISLNDRPSLRPIVERREVIEQHVDDPDQPAEEVAIMVEWGEQSCLNVPLVYSDAVIGCLTLIETRWPRHFTADEHALLVALSRPAAVALHNARLHRRTEEQARYLASLLESGRAVTSAVEVDEVLARLTREATETLRAGYGIAYVYDETIDAQVCRAIHERTSSPTTPVVLGTSYDLAPRPSQRAVLFSDEVVEDRMSDAGLVADRRADLEEWHVKTCLRVPLRFEGEPLGALCLYETGRERRFSDEERRYAKGLGEQAAIAINNARLYEAIDSQRRRLDVLLDSTRAITSTVVLEEVLANVARVTGEALKVTSVDIHAYHRDRDILTLEGYWSLDGATKDDLAAIGTVISLADRPDWRASLDSRSIRETNIDAMPAEERAIWDTYGYTACLEAPLVNGNDVLGVLSVAETRRARVFSAAEKALFGELSHIAATAIHNAQQHRRQEEQSRRLASLLDASRAITSTIVLDDVLAIVAQRAAEAIGAQICVIYEYVPDDDSMAGRSVYPPEAAATLALNGALDYSLDDNPVDRELLHQDEVVEQRVSDPALAEVVRERMRHAGEKTWLTVPLAFKETRLGLMVLVECDQERHFASDEVESVTGLGEQASIAIHNARLYEELDRQRRWLDSLVNASKAITSGIELEEVLTEVVRSVGEAMRTWRTSIHGLSQSDDHLTLLAQWCRDGLDDADMADTGSVVDLADRPDRRRVIESDEVIVSSRGDPGLDEHRRTLMDEWHYSATMSVRLVYGGEVIGILGLAETDPARRFTKADAELFGELATQAAIAIHKAQSYRQREEQSRRLASLVESTRAITSSVVLEEVLTTVAEKAATALDAEQCVIYEYLPDEDAIAYRSFYPPEAWDGFEEHLGAHYPLADDVADRALLKTGGVLRECVSDPALSDAVRADMESWGEKSCLSVALMFEGTPLGLMVLLEHEHDRHFTDEECELFQALGEQAALAFNSARLYRRLEEQNRRLLALLESSRVLTTVLDEDSTVAGMEEQIADLLGEGWAIAATVPKRAGEKLNGRAAPSAPGDPLIEEALAERRLAQNGEGQRPRLVVPLVFADDESGYLDIVGPAGRRLEHDVVEFVQTVVNQTAAAIENARLYRRVQRLAVTDDLTGLYNHRFFYERLRAELRAARAQRAPLSLLLIAIDDFQWLRDRHGHETSDAILRAVGETLATQARDDVDIACRYGGEEFAVILPGIALEVGNGEAAAAIAEKLRAAIEKLEVGPLRAGLVTITVGIAAYPDHAADSDGMIALADSALADARLQGKNRVGTARAWV